MSDSWADWRGRLAAANDLSLWPIEAMESEIEAGRAHFWSDGESAVVTRPVRYPGGAVVIEVLSAAGVLSSLWKRIAPAVEAQGRALGATKLYAMGRIGWSRSSRPEGWKTEMAVIMKDLGA